MNENKICEICGNDFIASKSDQKYCPTCGKNPERARARYKIAVRINKEHAGDAFKPKQCVCVECGKAFMSVYNRDLCSDTCRHTYRLKTAKCPVCGVLLASKGIVAERGYCSDSCKEAHRLKVAIEQGRYIACEQCGKMFISKKEYGRFCGNTCARAYQQAHKKTYVQSATPISTTHCAHCGKIIEQTPFQRTKKYCSMECRKAAYQQKSRTNPMPPSKSTEHICLRCKTSQALCERFTSNFVDIPMGAETKRVGGKDIVVSCPKFS